MSMAHHARALRDYAAKHFRWGTDADGKVATITLDRPEKKNPLTFDSYAELRDLFRGLVYASDVKVVVVTGAGGNVTGITAALVKEGLVERRAIAGDRRAHAVRLTAAGKRAFDAMAAEHERWVKEIFAGLGDSDRDRLHALLGRLKKSMAAQGAAAGGGNP